MIIVKYIQEFSGAVEGSVGSVQFQIVPCPSLYFSQGPQAPSNVVSYIYFRLQIRYQTSGKFEQFSYSSSHCVEKQQIQLRTSTIHLAQELLMNVQCSGSSRSFAKDTRTLKMKSAVTGHRKLTMTTEIYHQRGSSYNYMRSC